MTAGVLFPGSTKLLVRCISGSAKLLVSRSLVQQSCWIVDLRFSKAVGELISGSQSSAGTSSSQELVRI